MLSHAPDHPTGVWVGEPRALGHETDDLLEFFRSKTLTPDPGFASDPCRATFTYMSTPARCTLVVVLSPEMREAISKAAEAENRSASAWGRLALASVLAAREARPELDNDFRRGRPKTKRSPK
jgi:hypothetical protein